MTLRDENDGLRMELILRELSEAVLWLKSIAQGIGNMDTAARANHSVTIDSLHEIGRSLNVAHGIRRAVDQIEINTRKPPPKRGAKKRKHK